MLFLHFSYNDHEFMFQFGQGDLFYSYIRQCCNAYYMSIDYS